MWIYGSRILLCPSMISIIIYCWLDDFIFYTCFQQVFCQPRKVGLLVICTNFHLKPHWMCHGQDELVIWSFSRWCGFMTFSFGIINGKGDVTMVTHFPLCLTFGKIEHFLCFMLLLLKKLVSFWTSFAIFFWRNRERV